MLANIVGKVCAGFTGILLIKFRTSPYNVFFMHFCPGTMTTHAESINSDHTARTGQAFTTHNIEHRTEPVSH